MVKVERTPTPPPSLAIEKEKASGSYSKPDVHQQLKQDFNEKCYLCEIDELQSVEVEHLCPHREDKELKFAWDNLFYSCRHCNSVKKQNKYNGTILDCCKTDPETVLEQLLVEGHVQVKPLVETQEARITARLLTECFELTNTGARITACDTRVKALSRTMNTLYKTLREYRENPSSNNLRRLRGMLSRTYKFAGFTRTYVRNHLEDYPELADYVRL